MAKKLEKLYYGNSQPTAYAGADKLLHATRKTHKRHNVTEWLESQDAHNLHKMVRKRFPRRHYNVQNFDDLWEADLMDMRSLRMYNDGFNYVLVVIDVLSKYVWARPVKQKTSKEVADAFERILINSNDRKPVMLQTDKGKEFIGANMQNLLKKYDIMYRVVRSPDVKAAVAERVIRTLKQRLWRFFTHQNTRRYVGILTTIFNAYNNTSHSSTRMTPASVTIFNASKARENLQQRYGDASSRIPKYKVGELVRVSRSRSVFEKDYERG